MAAFAGHAELAIHDARLLVEHQAALHDSLTGLPGRRLLLDRLMHTLTRREREELDVTVLFLDLDRFKPVNDTLGHRASDTVLCEVARRLERELRATDTAARLGGDEFANVLPGADVEVATDVARRLITTIERPMHVAGRTVPLGAASAASVGGGAEDLLQAADLAMYAAKRRPGSSVAVYEQSMQEVVAERLDLDADVRHALDRQQLRLDYQPVVAVVPDGRRTVEALLRWRHPTRGDVSPMDLVGRAESTGEMVRIGGWVLREASAQVARWDAARGPESVQVAVNVSIRQLETGHFAEDVAEVLATSGIRSSQLILELTEPAVAEDGRAVAAELAAVRALGVRIAVDDFGSGQSSLSLLRDVQGYHLSRPLETEDADAWARRVLRSVTVRGVRPVR